MLFSERNIHLSPLIHFCEPKYDVSLYIHEFYNSLSNLMYIYIGFLLHHHGYRTGLRVMILGVCSFTFHSTGHIVCEIFDEIYILGLLLDLIGEIRPLAKEMSLYPVVFLYSQAVLLKSFLIFEILCIYLTSMLISLMFRYRKIDINFVNSIVLMFVAKSFWILERIEQNGIYCYLHSYWHIFSAMSLGFGIISIENGH